MQIACNVFFCGFAAAAFASAAAPQCVVNVADFMPTDGKADVADAIQRVIDEHPNRTIWFPDGTYLVSHPICTPAHPKKSVDLQLSNYAVCVRGCLTS